VATAVGFKQSMTREKRSISSRNRGVKNPYGILHFMVENTKGICSDYQL